MIASEPEDFYHNVRVNIIPTPDHPMPGAARVHVSFQKELHGPIHRATWGITRADGHDSLTSRISRWEALGCLKEVRDFRREEPR